MYFYSCEIEVSTELTIQVEFFWVVAPCGDVVGYQPFWVPFRLSLHPADGGSKVFWNFDTLPSSYTVSQPEYHDFDILSQFNLCNLLFYAEVPGLALLIRVGTL
jgi:hypothetical protein